MPQYTLYGKLCMYCTHTASLLPPGYCVDVHKPNEWWRMNTPHIVIASARSLPLHLSRPSIGWLLFRPSNQYPHRSAAAKRWQVAKGYMLDSRDTITMLMSYFRGPQPRQHHAAADGFDMHTPLYTQPPLRPRPLFFVRTVLWGQNSSVQCITIQQVTFLILDIYPGPDREGKQGKQRDRTDGTSIIYLEGQKVFKVCWDHVCSWCSMLFTSSLFFQGVMNSSTAAPCIAFVLRCLSTTLFLSLTRQDGQLHPGRGVLAL